MDSLRTDKPVDLRRLTPGCCPSAVAARLGQDDDWGEPRPRDESTWAFFFLKWGFVAASSYAILKATGMWDRMSKIGERRKKAREKWFESERAQIEAKQAALEAKEAKLTYKETKPSWFEWMGIVEPTKREREPDKRPEKGESLLEAIAGGREKSAAKRLAAFKDIYEATTLEAGERRKRGPSAWKRVYERGRKKEREIGLPEYGSKEFVRLMRASGLE